MSLGDLPVEIIPEVALYLDLEDIFSLQRTSRKLRESINIPVVWLTLAKSYSARHFHIYHPQSGGFDNLTEHELHKWIRKHLVFHRFWKAQALQPRLRALVVGRYRFVELVPGGRWLLVGSFAGSVWYYDLDQKKPEERALIDSNDIEGSCVSGFKTYTDHDTPGLHFNLAMRTKSTARFALLYVWQVKLVKVNGGDWLAAERQISFPTSGSDEFVYPLVIGRHVVSFPREHVDGLIVEIYWWKQCSATGLLRSHLLVPPESRATYLIGDDRILCVEAGGRFNLYDIPQPEYIHTQRVLGYHEDISNAEPTWSYTLSTTEGEYFSPLYHDGTTYRFTVTMGDGIWGFTIPAKKEHVPSAIQLSTFFDDRTMCIPGLYKAFALYNLDGGGIRIGYGWERGNDGSAAVTYRRGELEGVPLYDISQSFFDEESGRCVYHRRDKVVIIEFLDTGD